MTFTFDPSGRVEVDAEPGLGVSVFILRPRSTGKVSLHSSNPADPPRLTANFLSDEDDVRVMISGIRQIRKIMATEPVSSRVLSEYLPGSKVASDQDILDYMSRTGNTAFHQTSTCKMGHDAMSVVDDRLKVRGVGRLRVVDASIMPHVTSGNTNAPTLMIAAKGADMIKQDALPRRADNSRDTFLI
jgi:choline dehydrogenase